MVVGGSSESLGRLYGPVVAVRFLFALLRRARALMRAAPGPILTPARAYTWRIPGEYPKGHSGPLHKAQAHMHHAHTQDAPHRVYVFSTASASMGVFVVERHYRRRARVSANDGRLTIRGTNCAQHIKQPLY